MITAVAFAGRNSLDAPAFVASEESMRQRPVEGWRGDIRGKTS
ncbi:hypothetical protein [Cryobacterium melibiosiphilum]|nr:hypothetical protein [Cryobacterium melibiosiphilum]